MKSASVVSVVAALVMASMASGATVWNPAANGIVPPAVGNWNEPLNWTNDVPGVLDGKAVLNVTDAAEAQVTDEQITNQWVLGDNGPGGVLRVMDGGSLSGDNTPVWSAVGYNDFAHLIVEEGGVVNFSEHMWVAFLEDTGFFEDERPIVDIDGGTITVGGMFGIGWQISDPPSGFDRGIGYVNVNDGGLLALGNIHPDQSISPNSLLSINGTGVMTVPGDRQDDIANYALNGLMAGNGVVGAVQTALEPVLGGPGDFDADGDVDGDDFLVWQRDMNVGDLAQWQDNFGTSAAMQTVVTAVPLPTVASVPEPGALILMLASAFAWCGLGRRHSK